MSEEKRKQRGKEKPEVVFPLPESLAKMPENYIDFVHQLKAKITTGRTKAILHANASMMVLYWHIGNAINEKQKEAGWGAKVIDRLSYDLKQAFPDMKGFSPRNLKYMKKFAECWADVEFVQRSVAQIPWRSNITLMEKLKDPELRVWYAQKTLEHGWGKAMLRFQIDSQLHLREGNIANNFKNTLPPPQSDLTEQSFKDPYIFDFLGQDAPKREAELEKKLLDHIQKFLLELGQGFAFVGSQVHLELGGQDFYLDLLFYHLKLRCYVVVELKAGAFKPEYVSKLNVYQNVVNDVLKHESDAPTIGLLLVKEKSRLLVEYSLANNQNPIGVANWEHTIQANLPDNLRETLPSIAEIEEELRQEFEEE